MICCPSCSSTALAPVAKTKGWWVCCACRSLVLFAGKTRGELERVERERERRWEAVLP